MLEGTFFAVIGLLLGAKSIHLHFIRRARGMVFKKISTLKKKCFFTLFYCIEFCDAITSIDPKKQSEFPGLRPDAIGLVLDLMIL